MGVRSRKSLIEQAQDVVLEVAEQVQPHVEAAVDKGKEVAGGAAASLASTLEDTRDGAEKKGRKASKAVKKEAKAASKAASKQVSKESKAAKKSVEKSARRQAATVGATATAVAAAVKNHGEEPKKKGGVLSKLLVLGALAGVAGFLYKKFTGGQTPASTAPYTPPTSPAPRATPAAPVAPVSEPNDVPGADHPLIPESLDDVAGAHRAEQDEAGAEADDVQPWPHDHLDSQSDPLLASDEPAPYKPGKTGEALD